MSLEDDYIDLKKSLQVRREKIALRTKELNNEDGLRCLRNLMQKSGVNSNEINKFLASVKDELADLVIHLEQHEQGLAQLEGIVVKKREEAKAKISSSEKATPVKPDASFDSSASSVGVVSGGFSPPAAQPSAVATASAGFKLSTSPAPILPPADSAFASKVTSATNPAAVQFSFSSTGFAVGADSPMSSQTNQKIKEAQRNSFGRGRGRMAQRYGIKEKAPPVVESESDFLKSGLNYW